jgi:hypothetical protein
MKRAFENNSYGGDYSSASGSGSFLNGNSYIKLMNNTMNPEALTKQVAKSGPEGVKFLMNFLSKQCVKFQTALKSLTSISQEIDIDGATSKLFEVMMDVTNSKHATIYCVNKNQIVVFNSNWRKPSQIIAESEIFGGDIVLKGDTINVINFRTSDYYKEGVFEEYQTIDPTCIILFN